MLASDMLRVVPATIHIPLAQVPATLTAALLEEVIRVTLRGLQRDFALPHPRLAIAGLNPHAGEGGAMGSEEIQMIAPLIARLKAEGFDLRGPLSADTMFHPRARATYDAAICMYHDQALIPIKTLDFDGGVNVTLGLPFIRTSPDHGTGFDIAGKGVANPLATILSAAMMLRYTLNQPEAADRIESAVKSVLSAGLRTGDIWSEGTQRVGTREMGDAVVAALSGKTPTTSITKS